jgi:hypothetical protein
MAVLFFARVGGPSFFSNLKLQSSNDNPLNQLS